MIISDVPVKNVQLAIENLGTSITEVDKNVNNVLKHLNLPIDNIVVSIDERIVVYRNLEHVIKKLDTGRETSRYLSKFIFAVTNGLFDAALNYLWDAIINELRLRISNFDVEYFFDVVVNNPEKRSKLSGIEDLVKIQDSELLVGAKKIELITEVGYNELDHIRYMRNWASTAHPNEVDITGLKLLDWLEISIKNIFSVPVSTINIQIKKLLSDVKTYRFSTNESSIKKTFLAELNSTQIDSLLKGFFGIYVLETSKTSTKDNIAELAPALWGYTSESTKVDIGIKYGNYSLNGHQEKEQEARRFLQLVAGERYIPKDIKVTEVSNILEELLTAHRNADNFYTEPAISKELKKYISDYTELPKEIEYNYVITIVECFLTNGAGVAWNAEENYVGMINSFTYSQALIALTSLMDERISNSLSNKLCQEKFLEMLEYVNIKITSDIGKDFLKSILKFNPSILDKFKDDSRIMLKYKDFYDAVLSDIS